MKHWKTPVITAALIVATAAVVIRAQSAATAAPTWEAVSIRPCEPAPETAGRRGGGVGVSPGRLHVNCVSVSFLVQVAYVISAGKLLGSVPVSGGPAWIKNDRYDIEAEAQGAPSGQLMQGPMLQALLADRFELKIHHEAKQVSVYELVAAKGGLKLKPSGSCTPLDPTKAPDFSEPFDFAKACGTIRLGRAPASGQWMLDLHGMTVDEIAGNLRRVVDRPVINKTAMTGLFDLHLEFAPDETTASGLRGDGTIGPAFATQPDDPPGGPSIFTAIQEQAGLKLEPAKGSGDSIVIDSVERPSEN